MSTISSFRSKENKHDVYRVNIVWEKIYGCKNNHENSSTTKVSELIPSGFSMSTISSFRSKENKHDVYRVNIVWKSFVNSYKSTQWK